MKYDRKQFQQGNALIIVMVLFVAISLSIAMGLVAPVLRANRIATNSLESKRSYAIAESGVEDVLYRLTNGMTVSSDETLVLGTQTATTTVSDELGGGKEIQSIGDENNRNRTVTIHMIQGEGVTFPYGMQTGQGGITMANNSSIQGSVYSNGPITGTGTITGSATSANSASLFADQQNGTGTPANEIIFGNANSTQDITQSFQVGTTETLNKFQFYIKKTSTPSNLTLRITADNSGAPSSSSLATGTLSASLVSTTYGWVTVTLSSSIQLMAGTTYWFVLDGVTSSSKYYTIGANNTYLDGAAKVGQYNTSWNATSPSGLDVFFKVYLGGVQGLISGITVGSGGLGNAYAHTINNSTIAGANYCQTGTGNNKSCNTSLPDPTSLELPVSDQNIQDWKDSAEEGGDYVGTYTVNGTSASLGPRHITGDLVITNGATLTMTGTLWVEGDVTLSNNSSIRLSSSYGASGGVLVVDGDVSISNNATFAGSGIAGSYLMVLSTSSSTSAITVGNNAGTVILYAANGTVNVANNAGAREINGYRINLSNNAVITYESGVTSVNFVNGPSGGLSIQSWQETE